MTGSEHHEGSAGQSPAEPGGPRPEPYPEFPPLPAEHAQPQTPDPEGAGFEGAGVEGAGSGAPGAQAPSAPVAFALAETHPQSLVPGFEPDPDFPDAEAPPHPGVPSFGAGFAAYAANLDTAAPNVAESAAPDESAPDGSLPHRMRMGFRGWRRSRPFWGGLFVILGGGEILFSEKAPLRVIVHFGLTGLAGYLIPSVMVLCGVLMVFNPAQRMFYSILAVLLALATWPTSNLGGFLIGMLLGLIGGSLGFAWMPLSQMPPPKAAKRKPPKAAAHG